MCSVESGFTGYSARRVRTILTAQLKMAIADGIIPGPRIRACGHSSRYHRRHEQQRTLVEAI